MEDRKHNPEEKKNIPQQEDQGKQETRDINLDKNTGIDRGEYLTQNDGGTTDMGTQPRGNVPGRKTGSGLGTKTSVTGSDFDGQVG